jgi:hypothetical protein
MFGITSYSMVMSGLASSNRMCVEPELDRGFVLGGGAPKAESTERSERQWGGGHALGKATA